MKIATALIIFGMFIFALYGIVEVSYYSSQVTVEHNATGVQILTIDKLNLTQVSKLSFYEPDNATFKGVDICRKALAIGGTMPAIINGANEEAVRLFLNNEISFLEITNVVQKALNSCKSVDIKSVDDILNADDLARKFVKENVIK